MTKHSDRTQPESSIETTETTAVETGTPESRTHAPGESTAQDLLTCACAGDVENALCEIYPCKVREVEKGVFVVEVDAPLIQEARLSEVFNRCAGRMPGVKEVRVCVQVECIWGAG